MSSSYLLIGIGVIVGIYSGIMGLGGGTIMIPIMVLMLGFDQKQAVATSLAAMIPPVTLPAVIGYYRDGKVDLRVAAWVALGILAGAYLGQVVASHLNDKTMRLIFGFVLTYIAGYTIFQTLDGQHLVRSIFLAAILVLVVGGVYGATRWYDQTATHRSPDAVIRPM